MEIAPQLRPEEQPESTVRPLLHSAELSQTCTEARLGISRSPRKGVLLEFLQGSEYLKINILQVTIICEQ